MAKLELRLEELDRLPMACMRCGAQASERRRKTYWWTPMWIQLLIMGGILLLVDLASTSAVAQARKDGPPVVAVMAGLVAVLVIVALLFTRRISLHAPFCARHKNHWRWRAWAVLTSTAVVGLIVLALVVTQPGSNWAGYLCLALFVLWAISAVVVHETAIHRTKLSKEAITLTSVAPEFVGAIERQRRQGDNPKSPRTVWRGWAPRDFRK
jgi:hypothetical protein